MISISTRWLQKAIGMDKFLFLASLFRYYTLNKKSNEFLYVKLLSIIKNRDGIILDVGAGKGLQTISFAKEFPLSKVYSFDPIAFNVQLIEKQKAFYKLSNVKIIQKALGNTDDICELVLEQENNFDNYNLSCRLNTEKNKEDANHLSSFIHRLDSIEEIKKMPTSLIAIHINMAKFEWAVLQGGLDIIKRDKPVIFCKLSDNYNRVITLSVLKQEGYIPVVVEEGRLDYYDSKIHIGDNFMFFHRTAKVDPLRELNLMLDN